MLLISPPLYFFSFPAQIKSVIDRLYAYTGSGGLHPLAVKESYLFLCGGDANKEQFNPAIEVWEGTGQFLGWKERSILQTGGLDKEGAIENSGVLAQAEKMGRNIW